MSQEGPSIEGELHALYDWDEGQDHTAGLSGHQVQEQGEDHLSKHIESFSQRVGIYSCYLQLK